MHRCLAFEIQIVSSFAWLVIAVTITFILYYRLDEHISQVLHYRISCRLTNCYCQTTLLMVGTRSRPFYRAPSLKTLSAEGNQLLLLENRQIDHVASLNPRLIQTVHVMALLPSVGHRARYLIYLKRSTSREINHRSSPWLWCRLIYRSACLL